MVNAYYQSVFDFFGKDWFEEGWKDFRTKRNKYARNSLSKEIGILELGLHPLFTEVFRYQKDLTGDKLDFGRIPLKKSSDFIFTHLGRDLNLLEREIKLRGAHIKKDLQNPSTYENHRFNLMVAAGYKLLGNSVEFVPSKSSKGKTPDLLISNKYYIENKQRNQHAADKIRYEFLGELSETYLDLLSKKRLKDLFIDIVVSGDINQHKAAIRKAISNKIWRNQNFINTRSLKIYFVKLSDVPDFMKILIQGGHFQEVPVFTRTEDAFIGSEPRSRNVIMLNKHISQEELSAGVYDLLEDANNKNKGDKKLITYFDIGRAPSGWTATLADYIYKKGGVDKYQNIDAFVICQTPIQFREGISEIRPNFSIIGNTSRLGTTPDKLNLFGFQGKTGMDKYFIDGFLNPIADQAVRGSKYIECPSCGFQMIGIATNLNKAEAISQVNMPCPQCSSPMDMTLKQFN